MKVRTTIDFTPEQRKALSTGEMELATRDEIMCWVEDIVAKSMPAVMSLHRAQQIEDLKAEIAELEAQD